MMLMEPGAAMKLAAVPVAPLRHGLSHLRSNGEHMKVLESNFDNLRFERAFVSGEDGADPRSLEPHAIVSGEECLIETKPTHLDAGLAFCQPVAPLAARDWPVYSDVMVGDRRERWLNMTNNVGVVSAARHFQEKRESGRLQAGDML